MLQSESNGFRRALYDWAAKQITAEEFERWATELDQEGGQELHEFIDELENIVRSQHA